MSILIIAAIIIFIVWPLANAADRWQESQQYDPSAHLTDEQLEMYSDAEFAGDTPDITPSRKK